jgi:hypothetical protein
MWLEAQSRQNATKRGWKKAEARLYRVLVCILTKAGKK